MDVEAKLFDSVRYYIQEKRVKNPAQVKQVLKNGGATREFYTSELVTHVIADEWVAGDDPSQNEIQSHDHVIVNSDWVMMSDKCGAQLPTTPFEISQEKLFSGLVFCPSKLSVSDVEKLCILLLFHGGKMQRRLDSSVTHLVTMETTGAKYECAEKHSGMVVVSPDWILDSVDAGTRMDEEKYHPSGLKKVEAETPGTVEVCNGGFSSMESAAPSDRSQIDVARNLAGKGSTRPMMPATAKNSMDQSTSDGALSRVSESTTSVAPPRPGPLGAQSVHPNGSIDTGGRATTPAASPAPVARAEQLLDGVVIYFTDYQDCVEDETIDKWKLVVRQHGGEVLDTYDSKLCTHLLALNKRSVFFSRAMEEGKCIASAHWLDDVLTEQKMFPPRTPIHFPTAFQWQLPNADTYSMTLTNYVGAERELVKDMLRICGIPYTGHLSRENTHLICKKAEGKKYEKAVEWGVCVVNSTFLAEIIHSGRLPEVMYPCYTTLNQSNEFCPENSVEASQILKLWRQFLCDYSKHHPDLMVGSEQETAGLKREREEEGEAAGAGSRKLRRRISEQTTHPTVLFTGISTTIAKHLKQIVMKLGGVVTDDPRLCSHIVTPKVARTIKFLSGISVCSHMVTPKWVEESERCGGFAPEEDFFLRDPDAEQLFGMDLVTSLARAKARKLLEGMCVYATPSVQPPRDSLGDIVSCAGGRLLMLDEVRAMLASSRAAAGSLIVLSTMKDIDDGCCKEFISLNIKVFNAELILTGVLKQMLEFSNYTFLTDD